MTKKFLLLLILFNLSSCLAADFSIVKINDQISLHHEHEHITPKTIHYIQIGYSKLKKYFQTDLKTPVKIYVISSKKKYASRFNMRNRDIISGFANLQTNEIYIKAPTMLRHNIFDFEKIIVHELAHIFIQNFSRPHTPPRWLHEGLAMELEPVWYWFNFRSVVLPYAFLTKQVIPFKNLKKFPPKKWLLQISYEQSRDFISYLKNFSGGKKLLLLLKNYRETGNIDSAMILTYNQPLEDIEYLWMQDLKTKYTWFYILRQTNFFWFLISLCALGGYVILKIRRKKAIALLADIESEEFFQNENDDYND